ncbi:MAG: hypothetical protein ACRBF0_10495 [Calditrichia bacterium]
MGTIIRVKIRFNTLIFLLLTSLFIASCTNTQQVSRRVLMQEKQPLQFTSSRQKGQVTLDRRILDEPLDALAIELIGDSLYWDDPATGDFCVAHLKHVNIVTIFNRARGLQNGLLAGAAAGGVLTLLVTQSQNAGEEAEDTPLLQPAIGGAFGGGLVGLLIGAFSGSPDNYKIVDHDTYNVAPGKSTSSTAKEEQRSINRKRKRIYTIPDE